MGQTLIDIAWRMPQPPSAATSWQQRSAPIPTMTPEATADSSQESAVGWPPGTVAALREAYALGLARTVGWEAPTALPLPIRAALDRAASLYKRGVAYRTEGSISHAKVLTGRYQVAIEDASTLSAALIKDRDFVIIDGNVARAWPALLRLAPSAYVITLDEHSKSLASTATIVTAARAASADASGARWLVVGGGLLTDVVAFAASLTGAAITFAPTTLLAMADACIGGKTGVNFPPFGKNQLGAFYFPEHVHVWTGWLATLPPRELAAGGAECLKHAFLLGDLALGDELASALAASDLTRIASSLPTVIQLKADVVAEDPNEAARRATLNFGHTLAHALEGVSQERTRGSDTLLHGEAVGLGLLFALHLSRQVAGLSGSDADRMIAQLRAAGCTIPKRVLARRLGVQALTEPSLFDTLVRFIAHDKKNASHSNSTSTTEWILLSSPGRIARTPSGRWTVPVARADVEACWRNLLSVADWI